jgi:uncharacterized protein
MNARIAVSLLLLAIAMATVRAETPRTLMWEDLIPKAAASDNPFSKLTREQLFALGDIAKVRDRIASGDKNVSPLERAGAEDSASRLERQGVDVEGLLARRKEMSENQRALTTAVNAALDGRMVRMPGYMLPLEFTGKAVTEFLLVPWVGACIHTPPPPPNQIIHVKTDQPFVSEGLFMPVWITGRLSATSARKSLYLIDGESSIDIGYGMQAARVEPYKH